MEQSATLFKMRKKCKPNPPFWYVGQSILFQNLSKTIWKCGLGILDTATQLNAVECKLI